ncbi:hypothetical protein I4U23_001153 [Adineta vaga]|nr:hypothetical protein I4U23_001153 [Adineta vaga]
MMKLRRRPLSVYNASPISTGSNSATDQPSRKRQRKTSNRPLSDQEENESDTENRSPLLTSDESADDDDDDRSSSVAFKLDPLQLPRKKVIKVVKKTL